MIFMKKINFFFLVIFLLGTNLYADDFANFEKWKADFKKKALANNISEKLRKDAERFLFVDNEIFDVCLDILGHEKCTFRSKILEMHNKNLNFRKKFLHTRRPSI